MHAVGVSIIRIGFWAPLWWNSNKEPYRKNIGNYSGFCSVQAGPSLRAEQQGLGPIGRVSGLGFRGSGFSIEVRV